MKKTVVVRVDRLKKHAKYQKYYKTSRKFKAENTGDAKAGDVVMIEETRPLSKDKRWRVAEIVKRKIAQEEAEETAELIPELSITK